MRGKLAAGQIIGGGIRITPADAGKTDPRFINFHFTWDHPRGCGENLPLMFVVRIAAGSPPRMRGKLQRALSANGYDGITPADAGKTKRQIISECLT